MNADAFRHLYGYHFSENQKLWSLLARLPYEQFVQDVPYSIGSLRQQVVHLMRVDEAWFCELRGVEPLPAYGHRRPRRDPRPLGRCRGADARLSGATSRYNALQPADRRAGGGKGLNGLASAYPRHQPWHRPSCSDAAAASRLRRPARTISSSLTKRHTCNT